MTYPEDRYYTEEHEWLREADGVWTVGITDFAQSELGDVVFVELPEIGRAVDADEEIGTIESVKAVAEFYSPVAGIVRAVNDSIVDTPELVNQKPYDEGWLIQLDQVDAEVAGRLMSAAQYAAIVGEPSS